MIISPNMKISECITELHKGINDINASLLRQSSHMIHLQDEIDYLKMKLRKLDGKELD
jgi:hypothetical protein